MAEKQTDVAQAAKDALVKAGNTAPAKQTTFTLLKGALSSEGTKKRFEDILGKKAAGFAASITSLVSSDKQFEGCDHKSIIGAAMTAAIMDLPINKNFGFAYILPYNEQVKDANGTKRTVKMAQFQLGYKGYIQLAMRSGQYKLINVTELYENEISSYNRITGEIEFHKDFDTKDKKIVGYIASMKLINGFEKYFMMSVDELQKHAKKYSKSYNSEWSKWKNDFDAMAKKTVLKLMLSKWGILSIEMQTALNSDQAVANINEATGEIDYQYADNAEFTVDESTGELLQLEG